MASVAVSKVAPGIVAAVKAAMVADDFTQLGVDPRVYDVDTLPNEPVEPYVVVDLVDTGYGWDAGLATSGDSGWQDVQFTGVGRLVQSARWALDVVRSYLKVTDPATVAAGGDTHVKLLSSAGPPSAPIEAGTVWNVVEIYNTYLEAS